MKDKLIFAAVHGAHWWLLYAAFVLESAGALNVIRFCALVLFLTGWFALGKESIEKSAAREPQPIRRAMSNVQAWVTLLALVWFGHWFTGIAWAVAMACIAAGGDEARKLRASRKAAA